MLGKVRRGHRVVSTGEGSFDAVQASCAQTWPPLLCILYHFVSSQLTAITAGDTAHPGSIDQSLVHWIGWPKYRMLSVFAMPIVLGVNDEIILISAV